MKAKILLMVLFTAQINAQCWNKVSSGAYHTIAIGNNGSLWSWGFNASGQLGNGNTTNQVSPIQIGTATDWVDVSAGYYHSFAIKSNGTLWAWGENANAQLGNGLSGNSLVPIQIGTDTNWSKISGGENFSVAIKTDGTLWTWGSDSNGQMGNGAAVLGHSVPTQVGATINWAQIDAGRYHVIALNTGGGVFTWGKGGEGQLGNGLGNDLSTPFLISGTSGVLKIDATARGSAIILSDHSLWTSGQVGTSSSFNFARFQTATNWSNVSAGYSHVLATKLDGTLWAWGNNSLLQCSNSLGGVFSNPIQVAGGSTYSNLLNTNLYSSNALKSDGSLHTFGQNHVGQLALGNLSNSVVAPVSCPATLSTVSFDKEEKISIYPNPVLNVLNIEGQLEIEKITIYDITGKQIKSVKGNEKSILVDDLNAGFYLLEISNKNTKIYKKIVKR